MGKFHSSYVGITLMILLTTYITGSSVPSDIAEINNVLSAAIIDKYGSGGVLSREQFLKFVQSLENDGNSDPKVDISVLTTSQSTPSAIYQVKDCNTTDWTSCSEYLTTKCFGELFQLFSKESIINATRLGSVFPSLIQAVQNESCHGHGDAKPEELRGHKKPSLGEVWGYSIGFMALINVISNVGAVFAPFMNTRFFKRILMFFVALAVGTMAATGLLVLIPESMGLTGEDSPVPGYLYKMLTALVGIYFFFLMERIMHIIMQCKKNRKKVLVVQEVNIALNETPDTKPETSENHHDHDHDKENGHGHSHGTELTEKPTVATVAWLILNADGLHKFVDGLSIGAAFSQSMVTGISVSVAILCEEVPHEFGDIAILLHAGLSMKRALFYNLLAAAVGFLGLIVGIMVSEESEHAAVWIFAIAGGLFIYVPLTDMLPELGVQAKMAEKDGSENPLVVALLHNAGMIIGVLIIVILGEFGGNIPV